MEKSRKTLAEYGWVLIIIAIYDFVMSIIKNIVEFDVISTAFAAVDFFP